MWILVVMIFAYGGNYNTTPATAITSIPGFDSEELCQSEGRKLAINSGASRQVFTFCIEKQRR